MLTTQTTDHIGQHAEGYLLNAGFSVAGKENILQIQEELSKRLGPALWVPPSESLHITLLDLVAPLVDYGEDKKGLFHKHFLHYDSVLANIFHEQHPILVHFSQLKATPEAIILIGEDDGSFGELRRNFLEKVELLPGTKMPPKIVHSSICRYQESVEMTAVEEAVAAINVSFREEVKSFRLNHETKVPMLEFEVVKEYSLAAT